MPKERLEIKNWDGGLNNDTDEKDIKFNEFSEFTNVSNHKKGQLWAMGRFWKPSAALEQNENIPGVLTKDFLSTYLGGSDSSAKCYSFLFGGEGLIRHFSSHSLDGNSSSESFAFQHRAIASDGAAPDAEFSVDTVVWVVDAQGASGTGNLQFTMSVEDGPANIDGGAWTVLDVAGTGVNELDNKTFVHDTGTKSVVNSHKDWHISKHDVDKYGVSNQQVLGIESNSAFGFFKYNPIVGIDEIRNTLIFPSHKHSLGTTSIHTLNYQLMKESFVAKLVLKINATTTSPNITATDLGNGRINLVSGAVGTALNGKEVLTTLSGSSLSGFTLVSSPNVLSSQRSSTLKKSSGGAVGLSERPLFGGGIAATADQWLLTINGSQASGKRVSINLFKNDGSFSGSIQSRGYMWNGNASEIASRIETDLDAISGISAGISAVSTTSAIITVTASGLGISNGFFMNYTVDGVNPVMTTNSISRNNTGISDEHLYLITGLKVPHINSFNSGSTYSSSNPHDIYGRYLHGTSGNLNYSDQNLGYTYLDGTAATNSRVMGTGWVVYAKEVGTWDRVGINEKWGDSAGNKGLRPGSTSGNDFPGLWDWCWYYTGDLPEDFANINAYNYENNQEDYIPSISSYSFKDKLIVSDGNFNLPNNNYSIEYIDRTNFFSPKPVGTFDSGGTGVSVFEQSDWVGMENGDYSDCFTFDHPAVYTTPNTFNVSTMNSVFKSCFWKHPATKNWRFTADIGFPAWGDFNNAADFYIERNYDYPNWNPLNAMDHVIEGNAGQGLKSGFWGQHLTGNFSANTPMDPGYHAPLEPAGPYMQVHFFKSESENIDEDFSTWGLSQFSSWDRDTVVNFHASAVYNDGTESLPSHKFYNVFPEEAQGESAGGEEYHINEGPADLTINGSNHAEGNILGIRCTFRPFNSIGDNMQNWCFPDPRVVGIRLYLTKEEDGHDIYYSIGTVDFREGWIPADDVIDGARKYNWLYHNHDNFSFSTSLGDLDSQWDYLSLNTFVQDHILDGTNQVATISRKNTIPIYNPPSVVTYQSLNGFDPKDVITLDVRYKSSTIAGSRTFVGNIEVMEHGKRVVYNDVMVYSPVGKLDVLPYPLNTITINTSDGDSIVALKSLHNKVLQFKTFNLYIIDVSGGEPTGFYTEMSYRGKGLLNKNAVCMVGDSVFWFNKNGAWFYKDEDVVEAFIFGEDEDANRRISLRSWRDFVTDESYCVYNFETEEVIIHKTPYIYGIGATLYNNDSDMFVYNTRNNSWSFGYRRNLPLSSNIIGDGVGTGGSNHSILTNEVDWGGNNRMLDFNREVSTNSTFNAEFGTIPRLWTSTGGGTVLSSTSYDIATTGAAIFTTKIINLGSPEVKKSILGVVANLSFTEGDNSDYNTYAGIGYTLIVHMRHSVGEAWVMITGFSNSLAGTTDADYPLQFRHMLAPPINMGWSQMQFKFGFSWGIETLIELDEKPTISVNDINIIIRSHKEALPKVTTDEE